MTAYRTVLGEDLVALALFGSVARGEPAPGDVDVYVVTRHPFSPLLDPRVDQIRQSLLDSAEHAAVVAAGHAATLAPLYHTTQQLSRHPWILLDISHEGIVLHDPDGVLQGELAAVRRRLQELGSRRITRPDGTWYWDLKPDWRPGEVIEL